jgi:putative acetyltransferase
MNAVEFEIRRATPSDATDIAAAHRDSIHSIGARFYPAEIVKDWAAGLAADRYVTAMNRGEVFFIAVGAIDGNPAVLGFASHRVEDNQHRTAVYVRDAASRRGMGSALFRSAEAVAIAAGATSIHVAASLAAVEFYKRNGFDEIRRGEHRLATGRLMPCVFMRKTLAHTGGGSPRRAGD